MALRPYPIENSVYPVTSGVYPVSVDEVTIVDDFEDGNLNEYSGDTGDYVITTNNPWNGTNRLELERDGSNVFSDIESTSGLNAYPSKGTKWTVFVLCTVDPSDNMFSRTLFGLIDNSNAFQVQVGWHNDTFGISSRGGGSLSESTTASSALSSNTWHRIEVTWDDGTLGGSDNDITAELFEEDSETALASVSGNESEYADETGIGYDCDLRENGIICWDYWHITEGA